MSRRALEGWVRRWWRGQAGVPGALASVVALPLEALFRVGVALRGALFAAGVLRTRRAPVPVVSVGNLTVGGTGKTPVAAWVAARLTALGHQPALVARGYGRDEIVLHRRWHPDVPVIADPDRVRGAARAAAQGAGAVVLDDGFQHRRLARDLDVVLLAAEQPLPGPHLPRGPYREGAGALARAGAVVVTRRSATPEQASALRLRLTRLAPRAVIAQVAFTPGGWRTLGGDPATPPSALPLVATGVARPEGVVALTAQAVGVPADAIDVLAFADHHEFGPSDLALIRERAAGRPVVVTEKDAVKLVDLGDALAGLDVRVLALDLVWEAGVREVEQALARAVAERGERTR